MAKVLAVNISERKGVPKKPIKNGYFEVNHGLLDDAHAGNWHRQVSLLGQESIDKLKDKLNNLGVGAFAENLTTEGIILHELPIGTTLIIGETEMEVTQIGKKCHTACEIRSLVGDCVMPREGIFTKVVKSGWIKAGDKIEIKRGNFNE